MSEQAIECTACGRSFTPDAVRLESIEVGDGRRIEFGQAFCPGCGSEYRRPTRADMPPGLEPVWERWQGG